MSLSQGQGAMEAPMSSSLGAMGPLLRKLDLLLAPEYPLRRSLKQVMELLKKDLEKVSASLVKQSMVDSPVNKAKYWMDEVRELSYDMEDCIDRMMRPHTPVTVTKVRSVHCYKVARLKIYLLPKKLKPSTRISRIAEIRTLLREARERYKRYQLDDVATNPRSAFSGTHNQVPALYEAAAAPDLVGVDDSRKELTEWLIKQEEKQLKVLSIVGSAGVGKTTLVKELYRELGGHFECRAFIRVSRKPDMSKLLGEILSQVQGPRRTSDGSTLRNSNDSIKEHLQDKRYFIVIDDVWEAAVMDILNNVFPKGDNCSRIIITAEVQDVVAECCSHHSVNVFEMKPLGSHDSEKLFFHKVFGSEDHCPDQLKEVARQITRKCGGLPLAIITVAGLLANELVNTGPWHHLLQSFSSSLANLTLGEMLKEIVNLCYNSLPQYLKTCLLYLNMYPEGCTIWKVDLLRQWIAEGFVSTIEEGVVESCFNELIKRGMIQPGKINHSDEVVSCTVHHTVHDLITCKSSEEKFITAVDYSQTITGLSMAARRLSLRFSCAEYVAKPEGIRTSQVRSLAYFGLHWCMPSILEFKLLRILILEFWGDYDGCTTLDLSRICRLIQLRYLKVASHLLLELPSQIQGLRFLETLEIDARVLDVPNDIALLPDLLHLSLRDGMKFPDGIGRITSLQTLQYFNLGNNSEDNVRSLGQLMNLRDLCITCSSVLSYEHLKRKLVALFSSLGRLAKLRSLILAPVIVGLTVFVDHSYGVFSTPIFLQRLELLSPICTFSRLPEWIAKLQKLRILKIIVRELLQNDIDTLAGFPDLTALSLFVRRPTAESIVFHSGAFRVLKYFKYLCGALRLTFKVEALPNLQRLKLGFNVHRGEQYARMITGIEYLLNLKEIAVQIGATAGTEESDRMTAEAAFKDAIQHPMCHCLLEVKRVDLIEEEDIPFDKQSGTKTRSSNVTEVMMSLLTGLMKVLLSKLTILLRDKYNLLEVYEDIEFLHRELTSIEASSQAMLKHNHDTKDQWSKLMKMLYEISDVIDQCMIQLSYANDTVDLIYPIDKDGFRPLFSKEPKRKLISRREIKARVVECVLKLQHLLYGSVMDDRHTSELTTQEINPRVRALYADADHEPMDMDGHTEIIVEFLTQEEDDSAQQLQTICILGPGGIGKTTLAYQVHRKIEDQFDYTAFISVSENPNLTDILRRVFPVPISGGSFDLCQLIADVKDYIGGKRYLIIFDDIWSVETWEHLKSILPRNNKKSRVIITTRITNVAISCCSKSNDHIYRMDRLNYADSKELPFRRTFSSRGSYLDALDESANIIRQKCAGMPLALAMMPGLMKVQKLSISSYDRPRVMRRRLTRRWLAEGYARDKNSHGHDPFDIYNALGAQQLGAQQLINGNNMYHFLSLFKQQQILNSLEIFVWLKYLILSVTNVTELPNEIGGLSCLETLDLTDCPSLVSLPSSIGKLRKLCQLFLSPSVTLPDKFGKMLTLEESSVC